MKTPTATDTNVGTKPTLSKEAEKLFDEKFNTFDKYGIYSKDGCTVSDLRAIKQFIAEIEQRARDEGRYDSALRLKHEKSLPGVQNWIEDVIDEFEAHCKLIVTHKPPYGTPGRQFIENAEKFVEGSSK